MNDFLCAKNVRHFFIHSVIFTATSMACIVNIELNEKSVT